MDRDCAAALVRDQARGAEVVEVEVAPADSILGADQVSTLPDVVLHPRPGGGVGGDAGVRLELTHRLAVEVAQSP